MSEPLQTTSRQNPASRALAMSTTTFTVGLAVWTILSIIGVKIKAEPGLTETEFGLLIGTPILSRGFMPLVAVVAACFLWMHVAVPNREAGERSLLPRNR